MQSDRLLSRYLRTGSSADFERIVQAHGAMVFGSALRSTRSPALAEEVTQEVFIILARKAARIREPRKLAAWLHRTAIQCAANTNRKEAKRRRAMETYSDEVRSVKFDCSEDEAAWQRALPHLDQAIEELPSTDREAVIMRFYQRSSFSDIAELLNKSEGSCRKQVYRALDKLAGLLKKRGVAVPPTLLGIGLGGHLAQDALPMATGQITQLAMAAKASVKVTAVSQPLLIMSGYKLTILAASLAAMIPIGLQWQANRAQAVPPISSPSIVQSESALGAATGPIEMAEDTIHPRSKEELLTEMRDLSASGSTFRVNTRLRLLMFNLRDDEMEAALAALRLFVKSPGKGSPHTIASALFARWATSDPHEASRRAMEISEAGLRKTALDGLVQGWVLHDREALEVFIEGLPAGNDTSKVEASYWRYFTEAEPKAAADKALTITDPTQQTEILNRVLVYYWKDHGTAIEWLEKNVDDSLTRDGWLDRLIGSLAQNRPAKAFEKSLELLKDTQQKSTIRRVMEHWADTEPESAMAALQELPDTMRDGHIIEALGRGLSDLSLLERLLEQLPTESDHSAFVNGLSGGLSDSRHEMANVTPENIEKIRHLVEGLPPGEDRFSARWNLAGAWAAMDYDQAKEWYHSQPGVDQRMKDKFVKLNGR